MGLEAIGGGGSGGLRAKTRSGCKTGLDDPIRFEYPFFWSNDQSALRFKVDHVLVKEKNVLKFTTLPFQLLFEFFFVIFFS